MRFIMSTKAGTAALLSPPLVAKHSERFRYLTAKRAYLGFGYGDINYFTGRDTSLRSGAKALAFSDGPALQVLDYLQDPFASMPKDRYVKLLVNDNQLKSLLQYMDNSVALDATGAPRSIKNEEPNTGFFLSPKAATACSPTATPGRGRPQCRGPAH